MIKPKDHSSLHPYINIIYNIVYNINIEIDYNYSLKINNS